MESESLFTLKPCGWYSITAIALDIFYAVDDNRATKNVTKNEYVKLFKWRFLCPRLNCDQKAFLLYFIKAKLLKFPSPESWDFSNPPPTVASLMWSAGTFDGTPFRTPSSGDRRTSCTGASCLTELSLKYYHDRKRPWNSFVIWRESEINLACSRRGRLGLTT